MTDFKNEEKAFSSLSLKGDSGKQGKQGKKTGDYGGVVLTKVVMKPTTEYHEVLVCVNTFFVIATVFAHKTLGLNQHYNHDPLDFNEWFELVYRMVAMMAAKAYLSAMSDKDAIVAGGLSRVKAAEIMGPTGLVPLFDKLGHVKSADGNVEIVGQAHCAFTFFCRAAYEVPAGQNLNRQHDHFVNMEWPTPWAPILEYVKGVINEEARRMGQQEFVFGDDINEVRTFMSVPEVTRGVLGYNGIVNHLPWSAQGRWALQVGMMTEALVGVVPTADQLTALLAQNVRVVYVRTALVNQMVSSYYKNVTCRVERPVSLGMNWGPISGFNTNGSLAQILHRDRDYLVLSPIQLGGIDMDLGITMAGDLIPKINQDMWITEVNKTQEERMFAYVEGMMKGKRSL